ncbi:MAG TPA: hypothetical protein VGP93_05110, partial [Polyangiaceae bacterium]|nr:hypothetical protein [Polyangiaceae bacterium]
MILLKSRSTRFAALISFLLSFACSDSGGSSDESSGGSATSAGGSQANAGATGTAGGTGATSASGGATSGGSSAGGQGNQGGSETAGGSGGAQSSGGVRCDAFVVTGDKASVEGARFTYVSTDDDVEYDLEGILVEPSGDGPFPAAVISHGKGGTPVGYSLKIAQVMVTWGVVGIGVQYTHAPDDASLPAGDDGASDANIERAHKAYQLLQCLPEVDTSRIAAHGHSMGAFVTGQLLGTYPGAFLVASHTAGGVSPGPNATQQEVAEQIITPYQLHHGDMDTTVALAQDQ